MHQASLLLLMFLALFWEPRQHILTSSGDNFCASFGSEDSQLMGRSLPLLGFSILAGGLGCLSDLTYWHPGSRGTMGAEDGLGWPQPVLRSLVMRHPPPCTKAVGVGPAGRAAARFTSFHCFTQKFYTICFDRHVSWQLRGSWLVHRSGKHTHTHMSLVLEMQTRHSCA